MLAYVLALVVGLGSLAIYIAAFFFPEIHRKNDFIWSGVGLFYALVLWVFAPRITGGLLLGHVASVALLVWFGWQTLSLRRQLTPQAQQTQVPSTETVKTGIQEQMNKLSLQERLGQLQKGFGSTFSGAKNKVQQTVSKKTPTTPKPEDIISVISEKPAIEIIDKTIVIPEPPAEETVTTETETKTESVPEAIPPHPPSPELVEAAQPDFEIEDKQPIPVEEIAPDAVLAPPAETPPEQIPPNQGS
ncbi:Ycf66 family protein [Nostoc cf. edaphicum LEGE 07299]|uniref:Ycf66 family protein n=1 Tax=Nostoc cf. edaphicum LEGE 07299 TaxID=2777974 RepID=A0ABR9U489_9NOSO|nr:Ycf66 family protein [Nostoc edaphicum]MBE9107433.1 Ycf66 family protein [Nostoc cf. edaphicum LEGE 07299]